MYLLSQPATPLIPYIENYWFVAGSAQAPLDFTVDVFVDARADLIFNFGVPYTRTRLGEHPRMHRDSNLDAQRLHPIQIAQKGAVHVEGVRFNTAGLSPFVAAPGQVHRWNNRVVPIAEVFGASILTLQRELRAAGADIGAKTALLDRYFLERLRITPGQQLLFQLKAKLESADGLIRIDDLCDIGGLSIRHLDRLFRDHLGFSPKTFARIVRFQNALKQLKEKPGCTLADVAARCGYYDQPHFVREFKTYAGVVPSARVGYFPADAPTDFSPNLIQFSQDGDAKPGEGGGHDSKERKSGAAGTG